MDVLTIPTRRRSEFGTAIAGLGAGLLLAVLDQRGWALPIRSAAELIQRPFVRAAGAVKSWGRDKASVVSMASGNRQELLDLRDRVIELEKELLLQQNAGTDQPTIEGEEVSVLSASESVLVIDGTNGVQGDVVVTRSGAYVGITARVGRWIAVVERPSDAQSSLPVWVVLANGRKEEGFVRGSAGGIMSLTKIPAGVDLTPDLPVVTRGSDDRSPPGLLVGWTKPAEKKDESAVYQSVLVTSAVVPEDLASVLVIHRDTP